MYGVVPSAEQSRTAHSGALMTSPEGAAMDGTVACLRQPGGDVRGRVGSFRCAKASLDFGPVGLTRSSSTWSAAGARTASDRAGRPDLLG